MCYKTNSERGELSLTGFHSPGVLEHIPERHSTVDGTVASTFPRILSQIQPKPTALREQSRQSTAQ